MIPWQSWVATTEAVWPGKSKTLPQLAFQSVPTALMNSSLGNAAQTEDNGDHKPWRWWELSLSSSSIPGYSVWSFLWQGQESWLPTSQRAGGTGEMFLTCRLFKGHCGIKTRGQNPHDNPLCVTPACVLTLVNWKGAFDACWHWRGVPACKVLEREL